MQKLISLITFMFIVFLKLSADELTEGYSAFINNDIKKANEHFIAATHDQDNRSEAFLMLSVIASVYSDETKAFNYFMDFYKNSGNAEPYVLALIHSKGVLGYNRLKTKEQLNWLMELIKTPRLNPKLKAQVFEELGKYYEMVHDIKKSREYFSMIGAIMEWQITGDFENISASGFDKNYDPVYHPEPDYIFKNKLNADIKWFDLNKQIPGKWIDFTYNFNCDNTLVFAQTFCNSTSDQTIYLRLGTSGSVKLWVNDQLIFNEPEERNNGIDTYVVPVRLLQGNNRILLQIGCSKISSCNFMARATDVAGNPENNILFSRNFKSYNKSRQEILPVVTSYEEIYLLNQINEHPDKLVNYLVLANSLLSNDKIQDAMEIILKALKIAPNCSFILNQLSELYVRDKKKTSNSLTQEKIKAIDPDNPNVLNYNTIDAFNSGNIKYARSYIERMELLYGENKDLYFFKIRLASSENKPDEYGKLVNSAFLLYPDDYDCVFLKYKYEKESKQNKKGGIEVLRNYTRKFNNPDALKVLADEYIESGQVQESIEILKKLIEYNPDNDDYYKQLGNLYLKTGNTLLARQYFEGCLKIAPYYGPYHGNYARVLLKAGDIEKAINEYKLNIVYKPDDYEAIKKLRSIQAKKDIFDYFPVKDYYKLFENAPSASDYQSDNIISLADEKQIVLYENGGSESRQILLYKALTTKGIDNLKEYKISYSSNEDLIIEKAEVLKKNGNRLRAEINGNTIVYTSLEPGDGVLLIYKQTRKVSDQISKQFYEKWFLNSWIPNLNIEYNLLVDKKIKFSYKIDNANVLPEKTDKDEFILYSWKTASDKPIRPESFMPAMIDVCGVISLSTVPDWYYLSKWYFDISKSKTQTDREVKETVNDLIKGKENLSELEKAHLIYNFIEQNIHYSYVPFRQNGTVPQKASDVIITRIGDCKDLTVLFNTMCKVLGIKTEIVLVITRKNGNNWMTLPCYNFDHAISKATLDGKEYFIELTSDYLPFAALGKQDLQAVVLEAVNDSSENVTPKILSPDTRQANNVIRYSKVSFNGDSLTSYVNTIRTGIMAAEIRYAYRDLGKEEQEKKFNKTITDSYSNTKLLNLKFNPSLKDCSDTLSYSYASVSPKVFTNINGLSIVKLPLVDKLIPMDFLSLDERKFPVEVWQFYSADTVSEKIIVAFPEHKKLAEVPKSVHFSCKQAEYTLSFKIIDNTLVVNRTLIYKYDEVPVSDYLAYRSFIESVVDADSQQIGFN